MWNVARTVESEWLDVLQPDNPCAVRARRDLARINAWMLQDMIMARALLIHGQERKPRTLLDLGAGDGTFMLAVARRLAFRWPRVMVILLDRHDIVGGRTRQGFRALGWSVDVVAADALEFLAEPSTPAVDIITANLFLHHMPRDRLERLLALAARRSDLLAACEPRRAALPLAASRLLWLIGCAAVSRHDAVLSMRAGFRGRELSHLWPQGDGWILYEAPAKLFTHCFVARRTPSAR
jgi:hypothetical protein